MSRGNIVTLGSKTATRRGLDSPRSSKRMYFAIRLYISLWFARAVIITAMEHTVTKARFQCSDQKGNEKTGKSRLLDLLDLKSQDAHTYTCRCSARTRSHLYYSGFAELDTRSQMPFSSLLTESPYIIQVSPGLIRCSLYRCFSTVIPTHILHNHVGSFVHL